MTRLTFASRAALGAFEPLELGELRRRGQLAVPQQVGDLLERLRRGELLHGIPAIEQRVGLGADLRDGGVVDGHPDQTLVDLFVLKHDHSLVFLVFYSVKLNTDSSKVLYPA